MGHRLRNSLALLSFIVLASFGHAAFAQRGMTGTFITTNDYPDKWMWVTVYESTVFSRSIVETGCVAPRGTMNFVRPRGGGYPLGAKHYIRAEVTGRNCAHPKHCDTTITAYPSLGGEALHLIPNGNNCFWEAKKSGLKSEPPNLQAGAGGAGRMLMRNGQDLAMWVTMIDETAMRRPEDVCIPAGRERAWDIRYGGAYFVRARVATTPECRPMARGRDEVQCITAIRLRPSLEGTPPRPRDTELTLRRDQRMCYFESNG